MKEYVLWAKKNIAQMVLVGEVRVHVQKVNAVVLTATVEQLMITVMKDVIRSMAFVKMRKFKIPRVDVAKIMVAAHLGHAVANLVIAELRSHTANNIAIRNLVSVTKV